MRMAGKRLAALVGAAMVAPLGLVTTAPAVDAVAPIARGWDPDATALTGDGHDAYSPVVVVGGDDVVTAVWEREGKVQARQQRNGVWETPATLGRGETPQVDADDVGNVTVLWRTADLEWVTRRKGYDGDWEPRVVVQPRAGQVGAAMDAVLDVSPTGQAIVSWQSYDSKPSDFQARVRTASPTGTWGKVTNLTGWSDREIWTLPAAGRRGWAAVALYKYPWLKVVRHQPGGGSWSTTRRVPTAGAFDIAMSPSGATSVAWIESDQDGDSSTVHGRYAEPGGPFQPDTRLSAKGAQASMTRVTMDENEVAVVAWWETATDRFAAADHAAGGSWSSWSRLDAFPVDDAAEVDDLQLVTNSNGDVGMAVSAMSLTDAADSQAWAAFRPFDADWTSPERVTPAGVYSLGWGLRLAMRPDLGAVAVWANRAGSYSRVLFKAYDVE